MNVTSPQLESPAPTVPAASATDGGSPPPPDWLRLALCAHEQGHAALLGASHMIPDRLPVGCEPAELERGWRFDEAQWLLHLCFTSSIKVSELLPALEGAIDPDAALEELDGAGLDLKAQLAGVIALLEGFPSLRIAPNAIILLKIARKRTTALLECAQSYVDDLEDQATPEAA